MRVLFLLTGDETRASTRYRVLELLPYLQQAGIEYSCLSFKRFAERFPGPDVFGYGFTLLLLTLRCWQYDMVYIQKRPLPGIYIKVLTKIVGTIVYDFDDALYTNPRWEKERSTWASFLPSTLKSVTAVIAASPELKRYAKQYSDQVYCLPTAIPAEKYRNPPAKNIHNEVVVIGWIGNPDNLHYLASIEKPLRSILDKHDNTKLSIITAGDIPVDPLNGRHRNDVVYREWSLDKELEYLSEVDIAIRPLFYDEWTRAKGGFTSVVQCMALEIPVIVTPVGMLEVLVEHGISGFHAEEEEDWIRYIERLINDPECRMEMGKKAFDAVDGAGFWSEERAKQLIEIFKELNTESR